MNLNDAMKWLNEYNSEVKDTCSTCYITKQPIEHEIQLKCSHSFEYNALLNHLFASQRNSKYHVCPYCRAKHDLFIPYYQTSGIQKIKPSVFNNNYLKCSHNYCHGKNKGKQCQSPGHIFNNGTYCFKHKNIRRRKQKENTDSKEICKQTLKNGKPCSCKVFDSESGFCKRHYNLKNKELKT